MKNIKAITFKNFKVFGGEPYKINFSNSNLVLLDGPNGYGKTSVFDAIELALTGTISRLIPLENRQNPTDIVVAHAGADEVEITLEFEDDIRGTHLIQRRLKNPLPKDAKKISRFADLWQLYEMIDGTWQQTSADMLNDYLGSKNFSRDFLLFNYIQQEETARFLKSNNETQRAEELSKLFGDTKAAEQKREQLLTIGKRVDIQKRNALSRMNTLRSAYNITSSAQLSNTIITNHFFIFPWLSDRASAPEWDRERLNSLTQEKLNSFLQELDHIKNFFTHKEHYLKLKALTRAAQEQELIKYFITSFKSLPKINEYLQSELETSFVRQSLQFLTSENLSDIKNISTLDHLFNTLKLEGASEFIIRSEELIFEESKQRGLGSLYTELIRHHDAMRQDLSKIPDESDCPLCGQHYDNHDSLVREISKNGDLMRAMLSDQDKRLVTMRDNFRTINLRPLLIAIELFLKNTTSPTQDETRALLRANELKERLNNLSNWLIKEEIEHNDILIPSLPSNITEHQLSLAVEEIIKRILASAGTPNEGYEEANTGNVFDRIFREYFLNDKSYMQDDIPSKALEKEQYIRNVFYSSLDSVIKELGQLEKYHRALESAAYDINEILTVMKSQIGQYRKKLITDIEIPVYIYSGKILQTHQAGLGQGIFIKDPTGGAELKNVRLVSNWKSDHDILNTMSSGQISAVVISLTLALNRVYSASFSSILIDDPVQTMDDINMSSLVELLRNEFGDKQILLSTHEDKVSKYFTYKFLKYGKSVRRINIMERKDYIPSNNYIYQSS
ncbi:chromosome segregation protein SMC [Pseudomonas veronii 1YdBTEX2]|uniref:Chromosome segregation protein SMC n=1 Tax=Pseudomonas veronii 1YdBTEX2 TaxID=1295141 RepID=A0A1D3K4M6_PSEVE|nr:AAA family ATPase [Pseudomonas veronii]SBW83257.1 chromosome segregation protein SMC [Pseudomonas veronii 1YdBTEX2]SBW84895.1 chromosome segregation protein SMC [Pseudomonas veronii 1YdBTEX2]